MSRSDMSDLEWEFIKCVLPNKSRGVPRVDDRRVINGIFYALRVGCPWRDLPSQYGPYTTVYNRFNRWSKAGIWDTVMEAAADAHNVDLVMVDGTSIDDKNEQAWNRARNLIRGRHVAYFQSLRSVGGDECA